MALSTLLPAYLHYPDGSLYAFGVPPAPDSFKCRNSLKIGAWLIPVPRVVNSSVHPHEPYGSWTGTKPQMGENLIETRSRGPYGVKPRSPNPSIETCENAVAPDYFAYMAKAQSVSPEATMTY